MAASAVAEIVVRVVTDTKSASTDLKKAGGDVSGFQKGIQKAAVPAAAALAALGAAAISAGDAAADDAQAAAILAQGLKNSTGATQAQIDATETYIDRMAKATGVADDQLRPAMAALARGSGDVETAQNDLAVALDASVATGKDVQSISEAIAKAYGGNTASLKKLVPTLDAATLASGDMHAIMGELAKATGGSAAAAADTAAGKMARMKVAMGEAQEEIGAALLPAMSALATILGKVAGFIQKHPDLFLALAIAVGVLAGGILVLNVALTLMAAAEAVALGPILLIVAAVIALIVVVVLIIRHFDQLKAVAVSVWTAIANFATTAWNKIKAGALAVFNWLRSKWPTLLAVLAGPFGLAVLAIVRNWDKIKATASAVFEWLKTAWSNTVDRIKAVAGRLEDILTKPFDVAKAAVGHMSDAVSSLVGWLKKIAVPAMAGPFDLAKAAIDRLIGGVQSLVGWLGRIKIPSLGKLGGLIGRVTGRAAPATAVPSVAGLAAPRVTDPRGVASHTSTGDGVTVVVNGAIDPEATARQIRRILAGHSRRVGLAS